MGTDMVRGLLTEQRKRLVANLMGYMERSEWWPELDAEEQTDLRTRVLAAVNAYHDVTLDLLKVTLGDSVVLVNEDALRLIQSTHDRVRAVERALEAH